MYLSVLEIISLLIMAVLFVQTTSQLLFLIKNKEHNQLNGVIIVLNYDLAQYFEILGCLVLYTAKVFVIEIFIAEALFQIIPTVAVVLSFLPPIYSKHVYLIVSIPYFFIIIVSLTRFSTISDIYSGVLSMNIAVMVGVSIFLNIFTMYTIFKQQIQKYSVFLLVQQVATIFQLISLLFYNYKILQEEFGFFTLGNIIRNSGHVTSIILFTIQERNMAKLQKIKEQEETKSE